MLTNLICNRQLNTNFIISFKVFRVDYVMIINKRKIPPLNVLSCLITFSWVFRDAHCFLSLESWIVFIFWFIIIFQYYVIFNLVHSFLSQLNFSQGGKIFSLDFHRTADLLVTASEDDSVRLYDIANAKWVVLFEI